MENPAPQQVSPLPNQQWTYVIVDLNDGAAVGTDNPAIAQNAAEDGDFFVINVKTCQTLDSAGNYSNIPEAV